MTDITPVVLTYNELPNIGRTLDQLAWADHVIVVDSESTDGTLDILACYPNVEVVVRPFDVLSDQWNAGLEYVKTEWVLSLDADHVLSDALVRELESLPDDPNTDGYRGHFVYKVGGHPLRGTLYPPKVVLFRNAKGRFTQDGHANLLDLDGRAGDLRGVLYHDDRKSRARWLSNQIGYTKLEAHKLLTTPTAELGRNDRIRRTGLAPFLIPFYCLVLKGLVLDGRMGLTYTYERTYAELLLALQLLDLRLSATPDHA